MNLYSNYWIYNSFDFLGENKMIDYIFCSNLGMTKFSIDADSNHAKDIATGTKADPCGICSYPTPSIITI